MCSFFNVSRITVRKALNELVYAGYIVKKHNKGSFVKADAATVKLDVLLINEN
jgi:DNA-binding GntR family transcriptional regulator